MVEEMANGEPSDGRIEAEIELYEALSEHCWHAAYLLGGGADDEPA
jgi:hypothetical protein